MYLCFKSSLAVGLFWGGEKTQKKLEWILKEPLGSLSVKCDHESSELTKLGSLFKQASTNSFSGLL